MKKLLIIALTLSLLIGGSSYWAWAQERIVPSTKEYGSVVLPEYVKLDGKVATISIQKIDYDDFGKYGGSGGGE